MDYVAWTSFADDDVDDDVTAHSSIGSCANDTVTTSTRGGAVASLATRVSSSGSGSGGGGGSSGDGLPVFDQSGQSSLHGYYVVSRCDFPAREAR